MLTQEKLKEWILYCPLSGEFTWVKATGRVTVGTRAGSVNSEWGHLAICIEGKKYQCSHLAYLYVLGCLPEIVVDHKDGDPTNNSWVNLRAVDQKINARNRGMQANNSSGITGVCWVGSRGRWKVSACKRHIGYYDNLLDAVCARERSILNMSFTDRHRAKNGQS